MKKLFLTLILICAICSVSFANSPQFLWKPSSESNGKLVILFPSQIRLGTVQSITVNGKFKPDSTQQTGANGDRIHARYGKAGKDFGKNIEVKITTKAGKEFTWTVPNGKDRFEQISTVKTGDEGSSNDSNKTTFGDLIKAEAPKGAIRLTNENQGTEEYVVKADGEITVEAVLMTYGPAKMWIKDEDDKAILSWSRANDKDPAALEVNGKTIEGSNIEEKPGDFTAQPQKVKIEVKAGQVLKAHLSGEFGNAESFLVINE